MRRAALVLTGTAAGLTAVLALNPGGFVVGSEAEADPTALVATGTSGTEDASQTDDSSSSTTDSSGGTGAPTTTGESAASAGESDDSEDSDDDSDDDSAGSASSSTGSIGSSSSGSSASGSTSSGSSGSASSGSQTFTGPTVSTRWGPVQVAITVSNGRLTEVSTVRLPSGDHRSAQISSYAGPMLVQQALTAQSAQIDGVSGATYTTTGFRQSLMAALTEAGL